MNQYWKPVRYRLEYAAFYLIAALFRALPVETASDVSGWIWRQGASRLRRHQRALDNLAAAFPDMGLAERDTIARDMWDNLGRTFAEAFHLSEIAAGGRIHIENPEEISAFIAEPGGKLFCSGHFANWELIVAGMGRVGIKPVSIYQKIKNPLVDAHVLEQRRFLYTGGLYPKDKNSARRMIRAARNGGDAAFLVDLRDFSGVRVPFFGRPAPSTPFPALLVQMFDLPVYVCSFVREPNVHFRLRIRKLELARDAEREADVIAITASIHAEIERLIRANPAQWMWAHRRWG